VAVDEQGFIFFLIKDQVYVLTMEWLGHDKYLGVSLSMQSDWLLSLSRLAVETLFILHIIYIAYETNA
jgi:hypothetical protein